MYMSHHIDAARVEFQAPAPVDGARRGRPTSGALAASAPPCPLPLPGSTARSTLHVVSTRAIVELAAGADYERLRVERDLYLGLLGLNDREHPGQFLDEALGLIVRVLGADQGYLEVFDPNEGPTWWRAAGCSDEQVELIRSIVSRGIIQEALALGEAIVCPSAILDPRFRDRPSVQASRIEAVLCVPIVQRTPIGVLYITGRRTAGSFSEEEVERSRAFARHLAPLVEGLFIRSRQRQTDHVATFRARLKLDEVVGVSAALARVIREVGLRCTARRRRPGHRRDGNGKDAARADHSRKWTATRAPVRRAELLGHPGEPARK